MIGWIDIVSDSNILLNLLIEKKQRPLTGMMIESTNPVGTVCNYQSAFLSVEYIFENVIFTRIHKIPHVYK
jgi:hypothetical protein